MKRRDASFHAQARKLSPTKSICKPLRRRGFGSFERRQPLERLEGRRLLAGVDFSTFLGGSSLDNASEVAVDAAGNSYVTGNTGPVFPATAGAYDTTYNGDNDMFVAKFRPDGTLAWASYLGGSLSDFAFGIAVDGAGDVYVTGSTNSSDFPTTAGAFDSTLGGGNGDAFLTKVRSDGSALIYSTYLGGSGFEEGKGIALDASGNAYVERTCQSAAVAAT
jgi:hypothetical protein